MNILLPGWSSTGRALPASFRKVLLLGSLVLLAQVHQDSASRPTSDDEDKAQKSVSVSLSAHASGRWEPPRPANDTEASTSQMHDEVTLNHPQKQSNDDLQETDAELHDAKADAELHEMLAAVGKVDVATKEENAKVDSSVESLLERSMSEGESSSQHELQPDPKKVKKMVDAKRKVKVKGRVHTMEAVVDKKRTITNQSTAQMTARMAWQERVATETAADPSLHCSDDPSVKCKAYVSMFLRHWVDFSDLHERFTGDIWYIVKWTDERVHSIVPEGMSHITMNKAIATKRLWIPDVDVSNRAVGGKDNLFYAVKVQRNGECMLVRRVITTVTANIDFTSYPFDRLALDVSLGSPNFFSSDLDLAVGPDMADPSTPAVAASMFLHPHSFQLVDWSIRAYASKAPVHDSMKWGRIILTIQMDRVWWRVFQMTIVPQLFMIGVGYLVVWYPRTPAFISCKAGGLMVALLTMMSLKNSTIGKLPAGRAGSCWLEGFQDTAMYLIGIMLWLNVFCEIVYHKWGQPALAERMSFCLKCAYPALCLTCFFTCWYFVGTTFTSALDQDSMFWQWRGSIAKMQTINRFWLLAFFVIFAWYWHNESVTMQKHESKVRLAADDLSPKESEDQ